MEHGALIEKFSQTVGIEKAEALVAEALDDLGIEPKDAYTHHELADVCETIQDKNEGYVSLVANEIRAHEQAQQRFDALLAELTDPIVTVSFEAAVPIVEGMNPAFEETFDADCSAVGEPLGAVVDDEEAAGIGRWFRADDGGVEIHVDAGDERRTFLFRSIVVTRENGEVEGYGIYTEITGRKRYERQLEHQNEQLERFASVVSHDLRNPLTLAEGNLELALDLADDETLRAHLSEVSRCHRQMSRLIEDLLTLARQGQIVDSPSTPSFPAVVNEAWSSVSTSRAALELEETAAAVSIVADRPRLRQLLENLFRNAIEHGVAADRPQSAADAAPTGFETDGDGVTDASTDGWTRTGPSPAVTVRVGRLESGRRGFYVADDGPGIDPEDRQAVFEHGFTTREEGTGFGLAIVAAIVEAHDWSISVTESDAGGARFEIEGVTFLD